MGTSLADKIAVALRKDIGSSLSGRLPSMRALAARYQVSLPTILAATHKLREEGLIDFGRGRRASVVAEIENAPVQDVTDPLNRCTNKISERIRTGEIACGMPLGKIAVLAAQYHVSRSTIGLALQALARKGFVHKSGKAWLAGPRPEPQDMRSIAPPVIVLVLDHPRTWDSMAYSARTSRFCLQFSTEAERYGVSVVSAYTMAERSPVASPCRNLSETISYVNKLGKRCLGILIAASDSQNSDIAQWIDKLVEGGNKVVWYDRMDRGVYRNPRRDLFCRCHFSEQAAMKVAAGHLFSLGHRRILYGACIEREHVDRWQIERFQLLGEACARKNLQLCSLQNHAIAQGMDVNTRVGNADPESDSLMLERNLAATGATAIVAPRDLNAYNLFHILKSIGKDVPGDVSLLSFDNYARLQAVPVSTIDFGMGYLGYCAFHYLFGVIKISRERNGDIPARPHIVNRGSTARVGQRWLTLSLRPLNSTPSGTTTMPAT